VFLLESERPAGAVALNGNTLDAAGLDSKDGHSSAVVLLTGYGTNAVFGKLRNNILLGGINKTRYGVYEEDSSGKTAHPAALDNNDFWFGSGGGGSAYRYWDGGSGTDIPFVSLESKLAPPPSGNLSVDPLFVGGAGGYHLQAASPLINKGVRTEAPAHDMDGEGRPKGGAFDIGADEAL
jgi:hypothetical protein